MLNWKDILRFINEGNPSAIKRVERTDEEWKKQLSEEEFRVTRKKGTESPHSGELCSAFEPRKYNCLCCDAPLFDSTIKFESGTGWPSFTAPIQKNSIKYEKDNSIIGRERIEILCNTCDAHLGHVFPDGPAPSGLRYCVNSIAIKHV